MLDTYIRDFENAEHVDLSGGSGWHSSWSGWKIIGDNASLRSYICYIKGTKILLSNNTSKQVQDITYKDDLLVWDFDNGCYTSAKPLWIKKEETALYYYNCVFEDGNELNLVGDGGNCHAVYCIDENCFKYANQCAG
jgi:hypothetical protein